MASQPFYKPRLYLGDNLELAERFADETFSLCLFSSPYPGLYGFDVSVPDYLWSWLGRRLSAWKPKLTDRGIFAQVVMFPRDARGWWDTNVFQVTTVYEILGMSCVNVYLWDKLNAPPNGSHRDDYQGYELVFVYTKAEDATAYTCNRQRRPYSEKTVAKADTGNMRQGNVQGLMSGGHSLLHPDGALQDNVLRISSSGDQGRPRAKGGSFPRDLADRIILTYSDPGDQIVDICAGAGTTLVQGMLHGRIATGIELDPSTYEVAAEWVDSEWAAPKPIPLL